MLSHTEENYLKAIFHLSESGDKDVATNAIAGHMNTTAASVSDMIQKLAKKKQLSYMKYRGVNVTDLGAKSALQVIRKHRLWEVFLVNKLGFAWDEVHEIAEQLEHIESPLLTERLDKYLGHPKHDPHGDPIPDMNGVIDSAPEFTLDSIEAGVACRVVRAKDSSPEFLNYLDQIQVRIGVVLKIREKFEYDGSLVLQISDQPSVTISEKVASNLFVHKL